MFLCFDSKTCKIRSSKRRELIECHYVSKYPLYFLDSPTSTFILQLLLIAYYHSDIFNIVALLQLFTYGIK